MQEPAKFLIKKSGGYIVKWLIEGAKKAIDNNFRLKNPKVVQDAVENYRQDNDWMTHFLDDCCDFAKNMKQVQANFIRNIVPIVSVWVILREAQQSFTMP